VTVDLALLREHFGTGPSDDVLETALDAALEAIDSRYGPAAATAREYLRPFGQWVRLGRRASAVTSVLEGGETVASGDYALWPGGLYLRRLDANDDPTAWTGWVDVTYTPLSEAGERDRVTIALVDLDLNRHTGLTGITVGPWSEQYASDPDSYATARKAVLDSMRPARVGVW
jgi:hypothetical protein